MPWAELAGRKRMGKEPQAQLWPQPQAPLHHHDLHTPLLLVDAFPDFLKSLFPLALLGGARDIFWGQAQHIAGLRRAPLVCTFFGGVNNESLHFILNILCPYQTSLGT